MQWNNHNVWRCDYLVLPLVTPTRPTPERLQTEQIVKLSPMAKDRSVWSRLEGVTEE